MYVQYYGYSSDDGIPSYDRIPSYDGYPSFNIGEHCTALISTLVPLHVSQAQYLIFSPLYYKVDRCLARYSPRAEGGVAEGSEKTILLFFSDHVESFHVEGMTVQGLSARWVLCKRRENQI